MHVGDDVRLGVLLAVGEALYEDAAGARLGQIEVVLARSEFSRLRGGGQVDEAVLVEQLDRHTADVATKRVSTLNTRECGGVRRCQLETDALTWKRRVCLSRTPRGVERGGHAWCVVRELRAARAFRAGRVGVLKGGAGNRSHRGGGIVRRARVGLWGDSRGVVRRSGAVADGAD